MRTIRLQLGDGRSPQVSDAFLTFAQLRVLGCVPRLPLAVLGLGGAPVALPLQHVADHHPQQAQEEEHGHQDEGDVVGMRPVCSAAIFNVVCRIISCGGGRQRGTKGKVASGCGKSQRPSREPDIGAAEGL